MEGIKEENLNRFQSINDGRLSPERGRHFLFGTFIYTSLIMGLLFYGFLKEGKDVFLTPFEEIVSLIETVLYIFQCVLILPNIFVKSAFEFQKLQALAIVFFAFQLATLPFMFIVVEGVFEIPSSGKTIFYIGVLILGAIMTHMIVVKRVFGEAASGEYIPEGVQISFFEKGQIRQSLIGAIVVIIILVLAVFSIDFDSNGTVFLIIQTVVLYGMAIGAADFVLLAYCRFKFPRIVHGGII